MRRTPVDSRACARSVSSYISVIDTGSVVKETDRERDWGNRFLEWDERGLSF